MTETADGDISTADVEQRLQEFYDRESPVGGSPRVSGVTLLASGFETDIFAFSLAEAGVGAGETQDLILRVYSGEDTADKAAREFAVMRRLPAAGYPVPRVLHCEGDMSPLRQPFLIMERIHGAALWASYWSASEDRQQEWDDLLCRLMVELHSLPAADILPDSPLAGPLGPYDFVDHEITTLSGLVGRLEGQEPVSSHAVLAWLDAHRTDVPCERLALLHGDFHGNNVLLRTDGAPFVIDWSNVRLGDYRADLAWNRLLTRADERADGGVPFLRTYGRLAGQEVTGLAYFEVIACTRLLLSVLISLRFGPARQGMRPAAEALMRREAGHTRFTAALLQKRTGIAMPDLDDALEALLG